MLLLELLDLLLYCELVLVVLIHATAIHDCLCAIACDLGLARLQLLLGLGMVAVELRVAGHLVLASGIQNFRRRVC